METVFGKKRFKFDSRPINLQLYMKRVGFITFTAASHQGATKMFCVAHL